MDLGELPETSSRFSEIDVSPDGRRIASAQKESLLVLDAASGRVLSNLGEGFLPAWSPSGRKLAFYSARSGKLQLWMWEIKTNQFTQLTDFRGGVDPDPSTRVAGYVSDAFRFSWSRDETRIVFASRVASLRARNTADVEHGSAVRVSANQPLVLTNKTPIEWALEGIFIHEGSSGRLQAQNGRDAGQVLDDEHLFNQLFIVDIENRSLTQLTRGSQSAFHPAWSPVGEAIAYASIGQVGLDFSTGSSELKLIDAITREEQIIASGPGVRFRPRWSSDGSGLAYLANARIYARPRIHVVAHGKIDQFSEWFDRYIFDFSWSNSGAGFLVLYKDGPSMRIGGIDGDLRKVRDVTSRVAVPYKVVAFAQAQSGLVVWHQYDSRTLSTVRYIRSPGEPAIILNKSDSAARELSLGHVETVNWRNGRGEDMEGTLLTPADFKPGRKYPLIVDAYPMQGGSDWSHPMGGNYAWASRGYVVFRPSPRAPNAWVNSWRTEAWSLAGKGARGWTVMEDDVMSGVDELVRRGIVDPERMCLYGFSNGGGVVNYLVTRTRRFRCAVSVAPTFSNWVRRALLKPGDSILAYTNGLEIDQGLDEYISLSAVFHLSSVNTPMLIAVGDKDNVDIVLDSIEMYNGLRRRGLAPTLVRYPDQGHGFSGEALQDFWAREMEFFQRHLRPN